MLTKAFEVEDLRAKIGGAHGAAIDSQQTAQVTEVMRRNGNMD